ncbi:MAG: hypothetical protein VYC39_09675 [Myxococcota bacterium]|nr:hypothetical protein [Myxococcota bacterium]
MQAAELPVTFIGPIEDESAPAWHVEQSFSSQLPVKMRAHPINANSNSLEKIIAAVETARSISHDGIARIYGYTHTNNQFMVLTEDTLGLGLGSLLKKLPEQSLDPRLFLWLAMELIRIVDEVSGQLSDDASQYQILNGMEQTNVLISYQGQPKLIGLKPKLAETSHSPVTGLIKILKSIVSRCPTSIRVAGQNILTGMMFERLLQSADQSISKLESQVEREFFRTYKADEASHGQKRWEALVLSHLPSHQTGEQYVTRPKVRDEKPEQEIKKGEFTRALESRHGPVMPQPLTFADRVTGVETSILYEKEPAKLSLVNERKNTNNAGSEVHRLLWFTLGFVSAVALMTLYISVSLR